MKTIKRIVAISICLIMALSTLALGEITATAETSGDFEYSIKDGEAEITKYTGSAGYVTIPSELDGHTVTSIGDWAFANRKELVAVTIPDSVKNIGMAAFFNCDSLEGITIPDSVTNIGEGAFQYTSYYENSANWADDVLYIGKHLIAAKNTKSGNYTVLSGTKTITYCAFIGCTALTGITIPDSVINIGDAVLSGCSGLQSITVAAGNPAYYCSGNCLIEKESKNLIAACKDSVIPTDGSVESIGIGAFYGLTGLTSITIPDGVAVIGASAFENCTALANITIPDSITSIGDNAFKNTAFINDSSNWDGDVLYVSGHLIKAKDTISGSYSIKSGTKSILKEAFRGCTGLTGITIPGSVTSIGEDAFYGCTGLTSVTIPDSVINIGLGAFSNCKGLTDVSISHSITTLEGGVFSYCTGLESVTIPDSVTIIQWEAFRGCTGLKGIVIPGSVTSIGEDAFYGCTGLESVTIPGSVTSIGESAFFNCTGLTAIAIPDGVASIGNNAFYHCTGLADITLSDSIESLGQSAFKETAYYNDASNWEDGVLYIGNHLVEADYTKFPASYSVREGTKTIAAYAFIICSISYIEIPDSVIHIDDTAFERVPRLATIAGYAGTEAERFAKKEGFNFKELFKEGEGINKYKAKFVSDGVTISEAELEEGADIIKPADQVKDGYIFRGWNPEVPNKMPAKDMTFDAVFFKIPEYAAKFIADGVTVSLTNYKEGETIVKPADPVKKGYTFKEWTPAIPEKMPGGPMTFTAVFEKNPDENPATSTEPGKPDNPATSTNPDNPSQTEPTVKIKNYKQSLSVDYKAKLTFHAEVKDADGYEIVWLVNGSPSGQKGDTFTINQATEKEYKISASLVKGGKTAKTSDAETVTVSTGFFAKIIAFFRGLFGALPVYEDNAKK